MICSRGHVADGNEQIVCKDCGYPFWLERLSPTFARPIWAWQAYSGIVLGVLMLPLGLVFVLADHKDTRHIQHLTLWQATTLVTVWTALDIFAIWYSAMQLKYKCPRSQRAPIDNSDVVSWDL